MTREQTQYLLTFALGFLALRALQMAFGRDAAVWILIFAMPIAFGLVNLSEWVARRIDDSQATSILRSLGRAERERVLAELAPELQDRLRPGLALDGSDMPDGVVERFPFPARTITAANWLHAAVLLIGVVSLGVVSFVPLQATVRYSLLAIGILCLPLSVLAIRWHRRLRSVLEVSPFHLAEISDDGRRDALSFSQSLLLMNQPRWRRMLIGPADGVFRIRLHYGRMGFRRMIDLVLTYGGFERQPNEEL